MPKWLIYRAKGYQEIFMYDHNERLRWFPNLKTLKAYGYIAKDAKIVPISWFYDKPIVESIQDAKTHKCYPPEETPHYQHYRGKLDWDKLKKKMDQIEEEVLDLDKRAIKVQEKIKEVKDMLG